MSGDVAICRTISETSPSVARMASDSSSTWHDRSESIDRHAA
jgi:hypothetical protein